MGIFATARDTLFGFLIYITYIRAENLIQDTALDTSILIKLYVQDILHIDDYYHQAIIKIISTLQADFNEIIMYWIAIDDNKEYLKIGYDNRSWFANNKTTTEIKKKIVSEDVLRFT